ncbi:DUF6268 family outer membrane beta-barrel protein [Haloferula rosea]|uniref:DUF6268 domain-containing protein n=1 Tax=Haloferula rosea TaxID=490093 RepID=A0A934RA65_9BACT|nr:DUF6268 family outer membrane beta-barrel protein [Haloferula rosea]MBK1826033.1 hypothetical protein [Haloferula rosea]
MKSLFAAWLLAAAIQPVFSEITPSADIELEDVEIGGSMDITPFIDVLTLRGTHTPGMSFNELTRGEMDFTTLNTYAILGVAGGKGSSLTWVPMLNYTYSSLDVSPLTPVPGFDESLHEITLPNFLLYNRSGSKWFHGFYNSFGLRSDLGNVDSRDFFLSAAIGSGYQFNEKFALGFGVYASDITNDPFIVPAPVFVWMPTEDWLISYYGPRFIVRKEFGSDIRFGFEAGWNGGNWNVDSPIASQDSLRVNLSSFRFGLFYKQRIYGNFWGEVGVGYTVGNELKVNSPGGRDLFPFAYGEADSAPFFSLGLTLNRW